MLLLGGRSQTETVADRSPTYSPVDERPVETRARRPFRMHIVPESGMSFRGIRTERAQKLGWNDSRPADMVWRPPWLDEIQARGSRPLFPDGLRAGRLPARVTFPWVLVNHEPCSQCHAGRCAGALRRRTALCVEPCSSRSCLQ